MKASDESGSVSAQIDPLATDSSGWKTPNRSPSFDMTPPGGFDLIEARYNSSRSL